LPAAGAFFGGAAAACDPVNKPSPATTGRISSFFNSFILLKFNAEIYFFFLFQAFSFCRPALPEPSLQPDLFSLLPYSSAQPSQK
jgi:hypothetical protein